MIKQFCFLSERGKALYCSGDVRVNQLVRDKRFRRWSVKIYHPLGIIKQARVLGPVLENCSPKVLIELQESPTVKACMIAKVGRSSVFTHYKLNTLITPSGRGVAVEVSVMSLRCV